VAIGFDIVYISIYLLYLMWNGRSIIQIPSNFIYDVNVPVAMSFVPVLGALLLGLLATPSCLGVCMPFFVPFVMSSDDSWKKGFRTSLIFSTGRLLVYMAVGLLVFFVFSNILEPDLDSFPLVHIVVGCLIVIYAVWMLLKMPFPKICPARFARGAVGMMVGMLLGSFVCPPFIFMVTSNLDQPMPFYALAVLLFWLGSSVSIVLLGTGAGYISRHVHKRFDPEAVRNVMYMVLILVGVVFFILIGFRNLTG